MLEQGAICLHFGQTDSQIHYEGAYPLVRPCCSMGGMLWLGVLRPESNPISYESALPLRLSYLHNSGSHNAVFQLKKQKYN